MLTMANFEKSFIYILSDEGGFVNDPRDRGGMTKYGISKKRFPNIDIESLTRTDAEGLYREHYWDNTMFKDIDNQDIANKLFGLSINMGYAGAAVQRALRAANGVLLKEDNVIGSKTIAAINACDPVGLLAALKSEAAGIYRSFKDKYHEKGWLNRVYR